MTSAAQRQVLGRIEALDCNEGVDRRPPKHVLRRSTRHLGAEHPIAEILDEQQAVLEILRQNLRRAQARRAQRPGDGGERAHHVLGQMRDLAVGLAVADRRAVRLARRIHQQRRAAVIEREPRVAARRCIALQIGDARAGPVRLPVQERHHIGNARDARRWCRQARAT